MNCNLQTRKHFESSSSFTIIFSVLLKLSLSLLLFMMRAFQSSAGSVQTQVGNRLAFTLGSKEIPKVNCPDYMCTMGVIFWLNMAAHYGPESNTFNTLF